MKPTIFLETFQGFDKLGEFTLPMFVIYRKPSDFPDWYLVRVWDIEDATPYAVKAKTLLEARDLLPEGSYNIGRQPADDPNIFEVWL